MRRRSSPTGDTVLRRMVDLTVSATALLLLLPVLAALAVVVRLDSPGPALYLQDRVGRGGRLFRILKFRTMVAAGGAGPLVSGPRDPRITRVGAFLRRTKLDELPQLVNVIRGEMTLVGPRAEVPRYVAHYLAEERRLLEVRPGLTGAGQVHFCAAQASTLDEVDDPDRWYVEHQLHPKLTIDTDYLERRCLRTDLQVLVATVRLLWPAGRARRRALPAGAHGVPEATRRA